jgi:hypothetical protein
MIFIHSLIDSFILSFTHPLIHRSFTNLLTYRLIAQLVTALAIHFSFIHALLISSTQLGSERAGAPFRATCIQAPSDGASSPNLLPRRVARRANA